jgi:hypothetical protein
MKPSLLNSYDLRELIRPDTERSAAAAIGQRCGIAPRKIVGYHQGAAVARIDCKALTERTVDRHVRQRRLRGNWPDDERFDLILAVVFG